MKKVGNFILGHFWDEEFIAAIRFSQSFQVLPKTEAEMSGLLKGVLQAVTYFLMLEYSDMQY